MAQETLSGLWNRSMGAFRWRQKSRNWRYFFSLKIEVYRRWAGSTPALMRDSTDGARKRERERERFLLQGFETSEWYNVRSIRWFSIWDPSKGLYHYVLRRAMVSQKPKGIAEPHSWRLEVGELRSITAIECMIVPVSSKSHSMNVLQIPAG